jgi:allantoinase
MDTLMKLPMHDRYPYSYIDDRPDYNWPGGKRLAFFVGTNLEYFAFKAGDGALDNAVVDAKQTHRNYAWRDYGLRVGLSYLLDMFDELGIPAAHNTNSMLYDHRAAIFPRIRKRGDEIVGHGRTNAEHQDHMWELDEARMIQDVTSAIAHHEGKPPAGWMGPGLAESNVTPDLLQEAGYKYLMDWPCDDQPIWMKTRGGRILAVPYSVEINDGPVIARRQHSAREFSDMIVDHYEELLKQSVKRPLVCSVVIHPFIMGQPFRLRALRQALEHCVRHPLRERVWYTLPARIAEYCYSLPDGIVPACV